MHSTHCISMDALLVFHFVSPFLSPVSMSCLLGSCHYMISITDLFFNWLCFLAWACVLFICVGVFATCARILCILRIIFGKRFVFLPIPKLPIRSFVYSSFLFMRFISLQFTDGIEIVNTLRPLLFHYFAFHLWKWKEI